MENNSCLIFNDFLEAGINADVYDHAVGKKEDFEHTKTADKDGTGQVNEKWRHSNSLMPIHFKDYYKILGKKIKGQIADITEKLGDNICILFSLHSPRIYRGAIAVSA